MSITIILISALLSGSTSLLDDSVYPDDSDDPDSSALTGLEEGWVDEALLDVAFYLRLHKFGDFDRRYER